MEEKEKGKLRFLWKRKPTKKALSDYRAYECKLCGKYFEPKILNVIMGKDVILSAYSQLKRHLLLVHGKKSVKKKYARKIGRYCKG